MKHVGKKYNHAPSLQTASLRKNEARRERTQSVGEYG